MKGVELHAVGVATPAVLTKELAEGCADYITTVVLQHDIVPRFSIHNVFEMKKEMDATKWGDILADKIKDWCAFWLCGRLCACLRIFLGLVLSCFAVQLACRAQACVRQTPLTPTHPETHQRNANKTPFKFIRKQGRARRDRAQRDVPEAGGARQPPRRRGGER